MPPDQRPDDRENPADENLRSTFLNESDLPSSDDADPNRETNQKRDGKDTLSFGNDSLLGETVTLSDDESRVLGNFRLISKLGSGGFGTVYKAEDLRLERFVAIKAALRRPADTGDEQYRRVIHEGRAAAALDHPNIVSIYDVAHLDGKPYIISQLIDGVTLKQWKASRPVDIRQVAAVLIRVARAVDYAHGKGVVHRDLKPGNILMDSDGVPHVNDFGIAKHSDAEETISQESSIIGTPAYMSPEQAAGHSREADRRSDLYSLGVILYELATGEKPFRGHSKMLIHHVINTEPQPPRSLNQSVPRDVETICLKCLEKDPDRRYQSCAELADELQRFLDGEPILARPISGFEHFIRRCRRNPATTAITGGLIAAIIGGLIGVTWQWRRAEANRRREEIARKEVEQSRQKLADRIAYSNQMLHDAESKLAFASMAAGDHRHAKAALDRLQPLGDIEYQLIKSFEDRYEEPLRHIELIRDIVVSDDERFIAAAGLRTLLVWDSATGQIVFRFREKGQQLRCVDFKPGENLLAWGGQSGSVHLKTIEPTGGKIDKLAHGVPINAIAFSHDGDRIMAAGEQGSVGVWSMDDRQPIGDHNITDGEINAADFAGNGHLIVGTDDGQVLLCDITSGDCNRLFQNRASILAIDVNDDATQYAVGARDGGVLIGNVSDPKPFRWIATGHGPLVDVEFWESKDALVTSNLSGRLNVWRLPELAVGESHHYFQGAGHFAINRASDQILIGGGNGAVIALDVGEVRADAINTDSGPIRDILFLDSMLIVCHETGPASVMHRQSGRVLRTIPDLSPETEAGGDVNNEPTLPKTMTCVDHTGDNSRLAFGTNDGRILVWNTETATMRIHGERVDKPISNLQVTDDALVALTGGTDGSVRHWDLSKADDNENLATLGGVIRGLALSADQRRAVAVSASGIAVLIDVPAKTIRRRIDLNQPLHSVTWSPDSTQIAIGGNRGSILLFSAELDDLGKPIEAHNGSVGGVQYSPSGDRLVTFGNDSEVTFSNRITGRSAARLENTHSAIIRTLTISPDGRQLATGDADGQIRIWPIAAQ